MKGKRSDRASALGLSGFVVLLAVMATPGCYYSHLALGQARVLWARQAIQGILADPDTPAELARQLELVQEARRFARVLGLDVGRHYTSYVPWSGDRMVTIVVAARPGEVVPAGFNFPIVGRVPYKGFFSVDKAHAEARRLRERNLDICVVPVAAYSTLGWTQDPVTQPMLARADGELVELVIHELVHANVFAKSQPDFNEGAASFVGQEAAVRFFAALERNGRAPAGRATRERRRVREARDLAARLLALRDRAAALYAEQADSPERADRRRALSRETRDAIAALELRTRDATSLAEGLALNDACLALRGTYAGDTPLHERLLDSLGGDLPAYLARLRAVDRSDDPRRELFGAAIPTSAPYLLHACTTSAGS